MHHMDFRNFFKSIKDIATAKSYSAFIPGGLPVNPSQWDGVDYLTALEISLYTNRAIQKRAEKTGEIEFVLHNAKGIEIKNDPLVALLSRPNKVFTGRQFWALWQKYYDAIGETYILLEADRAIFEKNKKIKALHLLIPTMMKPVLDKVTGEIIEYKYTRKTGETVYSADQIIYTHNPDPRDPMRGQSILKAGISAIQTESQISTYHSRVIQNGGKVEGVFTFKTPSLSKQQLSELKAAYLKEYATAKKTGTPLFLGGDSEYKRVGLSPEELSYLEAKKATLDDICILTGVPKSILMSTSEVKFDNADAERINFLRDTVYPNLQNLVTALDEKLFPDERTLTCIDPTPENLEEKRKNIQLASDINAITTNEKRELLADLGIVVDAVKEGKNILVPIALVPLKDSGAQPQKGAKTKSEDDGFVHIVPIDHRENYADHINKQIDARADRLKASLDVLTRNQHDNLITTIGTEDYTKTANGRKRKAIGSDTKGKIDKFFDGQGVLFAEFVIPYLLEYAKEAGTDALSMLDPDKDFNLNEVLLNALKKRAEEFGLGVNKTTREKVTEAISTGLDDGLGMIEISDKIKAVYDEFSLWRSDLIARTEATASSNEGHLQAFKQSGIATHKEWLNAGDSRVREAHMDEPVGVGGQIVKVDKTFKNGLMYPNEPNCRCVIAPVFYE